MGIEFELKYRATPEQLAAIDSAFASPFRVLTMQTVYYDTPGGEFSARKITLRRRMESGTPVCTLKTSAGGLARGEYECCCDSIEAALPELCKLAGLPELLRLAEPGLRSVCGARFTRIAKQLTFPDFTAELALDQGFLTGGGREVPFCEAEVELKSGSREALCDFARKMAADFGLAPEAHSKFRRALALAKGE